MIIIYLLAYCIYLAIFVYLGYLVYKLIRNRIFKLDDYREKKINLLKDIDENLSLLILERKCYKK